MPRPSLSQRSNFKSYLRFFRNKFNSSLQKLPEYWIDNMLSSKAAGIATDTDVNVVIFDNKDTIGITTVFNDDELIYIPALAGDEITLGIGSSIFTLNFDSEGGPVSFDGVSYGLNDSIAISSTRSLTIKGLGGALIQGGSSPTYSITESSTSVNEGSSVSFTVSTNHVGAGTTLYFNATGGQVDAADFSDGSLSGNFQIVGIANTTVGVATFVRSIATDFNTENETFSMQIRTGSLTGPVVATSNVITIGDVVATFSVAESATTVNEGGSVTFTLSGNNIPAGTYYYTIYEIEGVVAAADFNPAATSGSFTVSNNSGTLTLTLTEDRTTEGVDKFKVQFRRDSTSGTIIAESNIITIGDVSRSVGENANGLTFGPVQVNRDNGVAANATDWYAICDLDNVPDGSSIALFIDGSGSMTQANVKASYDLLVSKLNARGITITTVTNPNEDWITPFLVNLP